MWEKDLVGGTALNPAIWERSPVFSRGVGPLFVSFGRFSLGVGLFPVSCDDIQGVHFGRSITGTTVFLAVHPIRWRVVTTCSLLVVAPLLAFPGSFSFPFGISVCGTFEAVEPLSSPPLSCLL